MDNKKNVSEPPPVGSTLFKPSVQLFSNATSMIAKSAQQNQPPQNHPVFSGGFGGHGFGNLFSKTTTSSTENVVEQQKTQLPKTFVFSKSQDSNASVKSSTTKFPVSSIKAAEFAEDQPNLFTHSSTDQSPVSPDAENSKLSAGIVKRRSSSTSRVLDSTQLELCTTIRLLNIPKNVNNKNFLFDHFSRFGQISKISCRLKTDTATVEFIDHESAKNARENGSQLKPNMSPVKIFYVLPNTLAQNDKMPLPIESRPATRPVATSDIAKRFGDPLNKTRSAQRAQSGVNKSGQKLPVVNLEQTGNILFEAENLHSIVAQLKSLIGQQAVSAHEKKELLENRDKILRKYRVKVNDVNQAAVFRGTCPDMCPEKERYRREVQKLLHPYEVIPSSQGAVDHYRAVKDYSRSSADQEEPLPHELRPVDVLERTMIYLIHHIRFDESQLQLWYDFLWNRTRSIRKDITQQMLHDTSAVSLIEKCVRFHIFSAYRLCELDIADFDQRMNSENLTKCLLSLRHMYDDLNKAGISCSNESEFRCYDVLLNLSDSNILRQILTYKQSVRQSSEIRFALKLFSAMQNSNYVMFFRLIREKATFLQACLVHRYFNRVRSDAMKILTKSYINDTQFPVGDIAKWLNFENVEEVATFCRLFGCSVDDSYVVVNRSSFFEPEQEIDLKLSRVIIEGKLQCSLGELFNGGPVPTVSFPTPVISFDADNRYINDTVVKTFLDAVKDENFPEKFAPTTDVRSSIQKIQPTINESLVRSLADGVLTTASQKIIEHIASEIFFRTISSYFLSTFFSDIIGSVVRNVYKEQKDIAIAVAKRKAENKLRFNELSHEIRDNLLNNTCQSVITEIVRKEFSGAKTLYIQTVKKHVNALSLEMRDELFDRFIENETNSFCAAYYKTEIVDRLNSLERIKTNLMLFNVRKCFIHWLKKTRRTKRTLKLLDEFPLFPGRSTVSMIDESTPPKKLRLVGYEDCPTPDCCSVTMKEKRKSETDGNGVFEFVRKIMTDERKREMEESSQEIRILLDKLKRGIEKEKSVRPND